MTSLLEHRRRDRFRPLLTNPVSTNFKCDHGFGHTFRRAQGQPGPPNTAESSVYECLDDEGCVRLRASASTRFTTDQSPPVGSPGHNSALSQPSSMAAAFKSFTSAPLAYIYSTMVSRHTPLKESGTTKNSGKILWQRRA